MIVNDIVYGKHDIEEKVLIELIESNAFQRLRDIAQQGVPKEYILPTQAAFSRYDHSMGTMLLLKRLGAGLEEQVAGLLHDVSHTAFSHLIDYVFGGGNKENYQDLIHHEFFGKGTELSKILSENGFNPERISNLESYGLLEQEQPELCADRVDYTMRYWVTMKESGFAKNTLEALAVRDGKIVLRSKDAAHEFAFRHTVWQPEWKGWGGTQFDMRIRWYLFGEALRIAIDKGTITQQDFMNTDSYVLERVKRMKDQKIEKIFGILKKPIKFKIAEDEPRLVLYSKFRYVDPLFMEDGKLKRLTEVDKGFKNNIEDHRKLNKLGIRLDGIEGIDIPINNNDS